MRLHRVIPHLPQFPRCGLGAPRRSGVTRTRARARAREDSAVSADRKSTTDSDHRSGAGGPARRS